MTAVVLLVLTGHAFIASANHFHRGRQPFVTSATGARAGLPEEAQRSPLTGGHEQCLLCRLQRNLVAELQHAAPTLDAPRAEALDLSHHPDAYVGRKSLLAPPGRAPPSA